MQADGRRGLRGQFRQGFQHVRARRWCGFGHQKSTLVDIYSRSYNKIKQKEQLIGANNDSTKSYSRSKTALEAGRTGASTVIKMLNDQQSGLLRRELG
jgi:hypothetical protein